MEEEIIILKKKVAELEEQLSNLSIIGVDISMKSPSTIIVVSKIHGGQIRIIDANFETMDELRNFVEETKKRYGIKSSTIWDEPPNFFKDLA